MKFVMLYSMSCSNDKMEAATNLHEWKTRTIPCIHTEKHYAMAAVTGTDSEWAN